MTIKRRTILKGAAAIAGAAALPVFAAADPLVALIRDYQNGTADFNARSASEEWGDLSEATYMPSMRLLCTAPPMPTSVAGALAGLDFVLSEMAQRIDSDANEAVLTVCATFLRQHVGASA